MKLARGTAAPRAPGLMPAACDAPPAWARAGATARTARSSPGPRWSWYARVAAQVGWPVWDA
eukprot:2442464-Pleurochrysis_carterae.AAC.1